MEVGYHINVWYTSRKKLVHHLVSCGAVSVDRGWAAGAAVNLSGNRLEFEHSDECYLLIQLKSINVFVIKLDNCGFCCTLTLI
jgi:hypothetical protein